MNFQENMSPQEKYKYDVGLTDTKTRRIQSNLRLQAPSDADCVIDHDYYKRGSHGMMFLYRRGRKAWFRANRSDSDIVKALKSADKLCFSIGRKIKGEKS